MTHHGNPPPVEVLAALADGLPRGAEVQCVTHAGQTLWIKRCRGPNVWVSRIKAFLFVAATARLGRGLPRAPSFEPPTPAVEVARLRLYHRIGLPVPRVLYARNDCFILEDAGLPFRDELHRCTSEAERAALLEEALDNLLSFHLRGQWHGGAQFRNLTRKSHRLMRLDFEEPYGGRVALALLQVLDLCLHMSSAAPFSAPDQRRQMGRRWFDTVGSPAIGIATRRVMRLLYTLTGLPLIRLARYERRRLDAAVDVLEGAMDSAERQGWAQRPYRPAMPLRWRAAALGAALLLAADDVLDFAMLHDDHPQEIELLPEDLQV